MKQIEAIQLARKAFGSQEQMAAALGVSQPTVSRWEKGVGVFPAEFVLKVEAATGISRHDLRPDIYPRETVLDRRVPARFQGIDRRQPAALGGHV